MRLFGHELTWSEVAADVVVGLVAWVITSAGYVWLMDRRHAQDAIEVVQVLNHAYVVQKEINLANATLAHSNEEVKDEITKLRQMLFEQRFALDK